MRPRLVIGLGNPLMGDEGAGWHVALRLAADPRLPPDVEAICGGTDLLRCAGQIEGRSRVILVDALQCDEPPGSVMMVEDGAVGFDSRQTNAHALSAAQAMQLLRLLMPHPVQMALLCVAIRSVAAGEGLSAELAAEMPGILGRVLVELDH
jgi:hydrogenase maturation protease